jgi:hypothetical protein
VKEYGLEGTSVLVTSRYDDVEIRARACSLGVQIIPKQVAHLVEIVVQSQVIGAPGLKTIVSDFTKKSQLPNFGD